MAPYPNPKAIMKISSLPLVRAAIPVFFFASMTPAAIAEPPGRPDGCPVDRPAGRKRGPLDSHEQGDHAQRVPLSMPKELTGVE